MSACNRECPLCYTSHCFSRKPFIPSSTGENGQMKYEIYNTQTLTVKTYAVHKTSPAGIAYLKIFLQKFGE